jgi:hypothetical protein
MVRIRIMLEDATGKERAGVAPHVDELGDVLASLPDIEGALEQCTREVLPDLTAECLARARAVRDQKKGKSPPNAR